jgi:hypothetical protein
MRFMVERSGRDERGLGARASALVVSVISLYLSKRSFEYSRSATETSQNIRAAEAKTELLALLSECRSVLNRTRIDIGALKAIYDTESQSVHALMVNYVSLFTEYLPRIEAALEQVETDWAAVQSWTNEIGTADLLRRQSEYHDGLKSFQNAHEQSVHMIEKFRIVLAEAKRFTNSEIRDGGA